MRASSEQKVCRRLSSWLDAVALGAVLLLFCAPLFVKLGTADLANDEAIYAYAVDRVLETGDWLTPRAIPNDNAFLEKPPLKFWLVAAPMEAGLLPHNEFGMRFVDALAGGAALVYVFLIGRALAGPLCGLIAAFVLVTQGQLVYVHGLRSNNMEAALLLTYSGGIFHFMRWVEGAAARSRSRDALAVAAWFVLGFMTKFVAALFLPLACALAVLWRRGGLRMTGSRWREWIAPTGLVVAATVPWFVYQTMQAGSGVWHVMFGEHVVTRLTSSLDVRHLRPWYFYFVEGWRELHHAGSEVIVGLGLCTLAWSAWRERLWTARLLLIWAVVPLVIISAGTSKLFHYAYPFLPPLALGAGVFAVRALRAVDGVLDRVPWPVRARLERVRQRLPVTNAVRRVAIVIGLVALAIAAWTAAKGAVEIEPGGVRLFKNGSVLRPVLVMAIVWWIAGYGRIAARAAVSAALLASLPWHGYQSGLARLGTSAYPLRAVGNCIRTLQASEPVGGPGIYNAATMMLTHSYFYYWRDLGWQAADAQQRDTEVRRRLLDSAAQSPILLSTRDYDTWRQSGESRDVARLLGRSPGGIAPDPFLVMLLPGRYEACVQPAVMAGARPVGGTPKAIRLDQVRSDPIGSDQGTP